MQKLKYHSIEFKTKRKQELCHIEFNQLETTGNGLEHYFSTYLKKTNQPITKELSDLRMRMEVHLMNGSEFVNEEIDIPDFDYETYFEEFGHQKDDRYAGIEVTKIEFIPNKEGNLHGVKIYGKKVTQATDKPFTNNIKTPVIQLNKDSDNYYRLVSILDAQANDLIIAIGKYLEKVKTVQESQLKVAI